MNAINPAATAQLEQLEREVLDAVYEASLLDNPEISRITEAMRNIPNGDPQQKVLVAQLQEVLGGTSRDLADWMIKSMTSTSRLRKAKDQYVLARRLLTEAGLA